MHKSGLLEDPFAALLAPYNLTGNIGIAVSGGADSMALALLMHRFCNNKGLTLFSVTVDHALRLGSDTEAQQVQAWLKAKDLDHTTLTWKHDTITTGLQKKARDARYALITQWCLENNISVLMTAHHALDQWETFMMRLSKGSGLTGLCGIRSCTKAPYGQLIRPLLTVHPQDLKETLKQFNHPYIDDPSNSLRMFKRVRLRELYSMLDAEGLGKDSILKTVTRFQQIEDYMAYQTDQAYKACVIDTSLIDRKIWLEFPEEIRQRVLQRALFEIGQRVYPVPHKTMMRAINTLVCVKFKATTMAGCVLTYQKNDRILIQQEKKRR